MRALITNPKLILADEPTGALDPITSREVLSLFARLHEEEEVAFLLVTHSREVASFADRSLELREGRFIAQHGNDVDISDLSSTRALIIDETGTMTLPPEILTELGGPGKFDMETDQKKQILTLTRSASDKSEDIIEKGSLVLSSECPACKYQYIDDSQECPSCGSSRPMVLEPDS